MTPESRRPLLIFGIVAAVVVVGSLYFKFKIAFLGAKYLVFLALVVIAGWWLAGLFRDRDR